MAVFPELGGFLLVPGDGRIDITVFSGKVGYGLHRIVEQEGVVAVHLHDDDGNGASFMLVGLGLIVDGLHILGVEFLKCRNAHISALFADAVAQFHDLAHQLGGGNHGLAVEFQHHDAGLGRNGMQDEGSFGDDAVDAFLLHAGQTVEQLVGHVLAKAVLTHVAALEAHHTAHAAGKILHFEDGGFAGHDLMAGMVDTLDADDLARRRDHTPGKQVVDGGAVLEAERAAGIFGHVAADGGGRLGGRIDREEKALGGGEVYGVLRDDASLAGHGFRFYVNGLGREARSAHHNRTLAGRHSAAGETGSAASGNEGELHLVGEAHKLAHLLRSVGFDHKERQLHAKVGSVSGRSHQSAAAAHDAAVGHDGREAGLQLLAEGKLGLMGAPEHGDAFADGRGVLMRQGLRFALVTLIHALPHRRRGDEGIVGHEEQLLGKLYGKLAHALRPAFELVEIDAQDTVDHVLGRDGNMGPFMGHGSLLKKTRERKSRTSAARRSVHKARKLFYVGIEAARDIVLHP